MSRKIQKAQLSFTSGEVDPKIIDRDDVKYYFTGAEKMRNVLCIPQGGWKRRPGLKYLDYIRPYVNVLVSSITATAPNGGTANNGFDFDRTTLVTTTTNISTTNPYVVLHYDLGSAKTIVFADVMDAVLTAGTSADFRVQYSTDNISWSNFGDPAFSHTISTTASSRRWSYNNPRSVSARYWRVAKLTGTDLGTAKITISALWLWEDTTGTNGLSGVRMFPFQFSTAQKYLLVFTRNNIAIYKDDVWQCDVYSDFAQTELPEANWTQSLDTLIAVYETKTPFLLQRKGDHNQWETSTLTFTRKPTEQFDNTTTTVNGTPAATSGTGINFTASAAFFTAGMVGKYIRGNGGFALIAGFTSSTVVTINVIEPYRFTNTNPIGPGDWVLEEDAWSSTRGYPRTVTFHNGRLWFGGSRDLPSTIWGSKSGSFYDFGYGSGLDDEAINITLDTDQVNAIRQMYSGRNLAFFTDEAEFYIPRPLNEAITPSNVTILRTSSNGIKEGVRLVEISGAVLFVQRNGKTIREFLWNETEQAYTARALSLLSSHLIKNPSDMFVRKSTSTDDADFILMPNATDGTLTVLTTLRDQDVNAFSSIITDGDFLATAAIDDDMYFAVKRNINGTDALFLEKFDEDYMLDCSVKVAGVATSTVTGLSHLNGETGLVIDPTGEQRPSASISGGSITVTGGAWTGTAEGGLAWPDVDTNGNHVWVKTLPFSAELPEGHPKGLKKRVIEVFTRLSESSHLKINGKDVTFASAPYTGDKKMQGLLGWTDYGQVELTQDTHKPLTVLSVTKRVAV